MDWAYERGQSRLESLPNELLHQIWLFSLSLDLPRASPALSAKLYNKETRRFFVDETITNFSFLISVKSEDGESSVVGNRAVLDSGELYYDWGSDEAFGGSLIHRGLSTHATCSHRLVSALDSSTVSSEEQRSSS